MPTGYTSIIEDKPGLTLREFALRCARGMGACIMQRDDDMDEPPKAPEPSDYHLEAGKAAESRLRELRGLSTKAARALFDAEIARMLAEDDPQRKELPVPPCQQHRTRFSLRFAVPRTRSQAPWSELRSARQASSSGCSGHRSKRRTFQLPGFSGQLACRARR